MKYENPRDVVDIIIEKEGKIVLIERGVEPFKGKLAIPGGHVDYGETVEHAAVREAKEETNLDVKLKSILGVYSGPNADPRGHRVSTVFIAEPVAGILEGKDDAAKANYYDLNKLNPEDLAFDHKLILRHYQKNKETGGTFWSSR